MKRDRDNNGRFLKLSEDEEKKSEESKKGNFSTSIIEILNKPIHILIVYILFGYLAYRLMTNNNLSAILRYSIEYYNLTMEVCSCGTQNSTVFLRDTVPNPSGIFK
jgi:hypothetical protein